MSSCKHGTRWTDKQGTGDSPKQLNYAAGRLCCSYGVLS